MITLRQLAALSFLILICSCPDLQAQGREGEPLPRTLQVYLSMQNTAWRGWGRLWRSGFDGAGVVLESKRKGPSQ